MFKEVLGRSPHAAERRSVGRTRSSMNLAKSTILLMSMAASLGCATSGPLFVQETLSVQISASGFDVIFKDTRIGVDEGRISVPVVSVPGQTREHIPPVDRELKTLARRLIERSIVDGSRSLVFTVTLQEGTQRFLGRAFSEEESVSWRLEVAVSGDGIQSVSQGESWGTRSSLDASASSIERMSREAFSQALLRALSGLQI